MHYMSSRASKDQLARTGETWAVTFSDSRVAECFIDGDSEFNFFVGPCAGGIKWYQVNPHRFFPNPNGLLSGPGLSNGSGSVPGAVESSTTEVNKRVEKGIEGLVFGENPEQTKSTQDVGVCITGQKKPEDQILASPPEQAGSPADVKVTGAEQQESETQSIITATTGGFDQSVIAGKPEDRMLTPATTSGLKQAVVAKNSCRFFLNSNGLWRSLGSSNGSGVSLEILPPLLAVIAGRDRATTTSVDTS